MQELNKKWNNRRRSSVGEIKSPSSCCETKELRTAHVGGMGSATVPVGLAGVSPASLLRVRAVSWQKIDVPQRVFGETPKTAVGSTALPPPLL